MASIEDALEWEYFDTDEIISNLKFETGQYNIDSAAIIQISRDHQYNLSCSISGATDRDDLERHPKPRLGEFFKPEIISAYATHNIYKYTFDHVAIDSTISNYLSIYHPIKVTFKGNLRVYSIEREDTYNKQKPMMIQDWFLGSRNNMLFPRNTDRPSQHVYKRVRTHVEKDEDVIPIRRKSEGGGRDYFYIQTMDFSFIVAEVPKNHGPSWATKYCIEYRESFGGLPNDNVREAISEIVGFILGGQLHYIGSSIYDEANNILKQRFRNPWGDNVIDVCGKACRPPVYVQGMRNYEPGIEQLLNQVINNYLTLRNSYNLKDVITKYWLSLNSAVGINLPILASAVEVLSQKILKAHPERKSYYIEKEIFEGLISDEIKTLEDKLKSNPNKEEIINKILGAYQRGPNEKLSMMFDILELKISKIEKKAMAARNTMAHSSLKETNEEKIMEIMRLGLAYETLFNRLLLKVLGYNGNYIDYYTLDHPERHITEAIPEV